MTVWESLKRIWSGEAMKDEEEKSQAVRTEVRQVISETRAMLDGEECWLMPIGREHQNGR